MEKVTVEAAEAIAISALQHLGSDDDLVMRFCAVTGILSNDIRSAAQEPGFMSGLLDFYLSHEPDLLAWTSQAEISPEHVMAARFTLSPHDMSGF
ncbi:MAG: DUF3572 domain-containing protein [Pseudomonadota bacterium]